MFIKTIKIKSFWAAVTVLAVIAIAVAAIVMAVSRANEKTSLYRMTNETQRQQFIDTLGWEVPKEYDTCRIVIIPETFDEVYSNYNQLQKEQGFDLEKYKGKTVEIYSYPVYNYEDADKTDEKDSEAAKDNVMMNLMVCDGMLIGGDVCSTELGGFMHGLKKPLPEKETSDSSSDVSDSGESDESSEELADDTQKDEGEQSEE